MARFYHSDVESRDSNTASEGEFESMTGLRGKRVVISGASSGIGLGTARALSVAGAEVGLLARSAEKLRTAVDEIGGGSWAWPCDVSDQDSVRAFAEEAARRWGAVDGLVNNAGIATMARLDETTAETWDEVFAVNVRGPFLMCRELGPMLAAGNAPSVVNVSSTLAERAIPGMAAYNASKAALNQLTRSLALEWAPMVRVNAVMLAVVNTPIHSSRGMTAEQVHEMGGMHPLGRIGEPADIAAVIAFLLSDESSWMTGTIIPVDGGMLAG
jgi:meso-butanediol dehydrogenase/(S,S)-butanediol dehydrogenase/diacetyl reductase